MWMTTTDLTEAELLTTHQYALSALGLDHRDSALGKQDWHESGYVSSRSLRQSCFLQVRKEAT